MMQAEFTYEGRNLMRLISVLAVLAVVVAVLPAQIPSGHYVVSSLRQPTAGSVGGLAIVHPTGAVPPTIITGLGNDLTGVGSPGYVGANSVAYSPNDGFLIVGEGVPLGGSVDIHQIFVVGGAVVLDLPVFVGTGILTGPETPGITQIVMLANGNAVFSVAVLDNTGPLAGSPIGLFDRATQTVSAIPMPPLIGVPNALAVDEVGGVIYLGMWGQGAVWSVPIAGGTPIQIAQVSNYIWSLALDENRNLMICNGSSTDRVDVQTGQVLETFSTTTALAVAVEQTTADPIAYVFGAQASDVVRLASTGPTVVASGVLDLASGITIVDSAREYGTATPGLTDYAFRTFPGVGGLPIAGNTSYAVQVDAANGNSNLGVLAASFGQSSLPVLGIQLLVDPTSAVALGAFPAGAPIPFALPAGLPPTVVFLQSIHLDAGNPRGLASSRGLQLTTIQ